MSERAAGEPFQKRAQATKPSYYDLLEIRPNASVQDIRRAYRDLSKLYHPDTTELESAIAVPKFQALNEAYATLSSPEKRLTYDYKTGFSRISVIQPLMEEVSATKATDGKKYGGNAYIDPTDRPLSAGELFALFILGITFVACLVLVVTLSITNKEAITTNIDLFPSSSAVGDRIDLSIDLSTEPSAESSTGLPTEPPIDLPTDSPTELSVDKSSAIERPVSDVPSNQRPDSQPDQLPEFPDQPWLMPKPLSAPTLPAR